MRSSLQVLVLSRWQLWRTLSVLLCGGLICFSAVVAQVEADTGAKTKPEPEVPGDLKRMREYLSTADLLEPSNDVQEAVSGADYRPLAIQGYSVSVPGVRLRQLRCWPDKGNESKVVPGTSDFVLGPEHGYLIHLATEYAARYNQVLFERLQKENRLRIPPLRESNLEYLELPALVFSAGLKEMLAHLRAEALKYHPAAEVPDFRIDKGTNESAVAEIRFEGKTDVMRILEFVTESTDIDFFIDEQNVVTFRSVTQ